MLKVVVADDEERICGLIQALVDWQALGLELAGVAENGIDALEQVKRHRPDILITDIRMPGCDGLELIEKVKKENPDTEIVIISGYAHFEYAQSAIRYGVGYYLLKPINKEELTATLIKLSERIKSRKEIADDTMQLLLDRKKDIQRLRGNLISDMQSRQNTCFTMEELQADYHLQLQPGLFQGIVLKIDCRQGALSSAAFEIVLHKAEELLENSIKQVCYESVFEFHGSMGIGILNYSVKKQEEVRKCLRDCLNQLEVQKSIFGPVLFSIALGGAVKKVEQLPESVEQSLVIVQERLLKGCGHVLEGISDTSLLHEQNLAEKYLRDITGAVEILNEEEADKAVKALKETAVSIQNIHGFEILKLVEEAGSLFAVRFGGKEKNEQLEEFNLRCEQCCNIEELFETLQDFQRCFIMLKKQEHENDAMRPIRLAKQYIQNHFGEQITLEEVSDVVGLSAAYFSTVFKKETGEGFAKYLINIRMEQAKILLRETNLSVAEICKKVGYNDLKHFTHTFEKMADVKPGTYRKLYG